MDKIIKTLGAGASFLQEHPMAAALVLALALSIALTEMVKSIWRNSFPDSLRNNIRRRNTYYTITVLVHWIVVGRIYSLAEGPFFYDVVIFSPVVSAVVVWILHRLIESMALTKGPNSIWAAMLARMKPHRVVRKGVENGSTYFELDENRSLLLKEKQEKNR